MNNLNRLCKTTLAARANPHSHSPQRSRHAPSRARNRKNLTTTRQQAEFILTPDDDGPTQRKKRKPRSDRTQCISRPAYPKPVAADSVRVCEDPPKSIQRVRTPMRVATHTPKDQNQPPKKSEYDEATLSSCFASGRENYQFGGPSVCGNWNFECPLYSSPPKPRQVIGNHSLSIALGQHIPETTERSGFHLIPIDSFIPGDHPEQIYIPDRFDSKEVLMFCGFDERTTDGMFWKWDRMGRPGDLIDIAKEHVKSIATAKGFNPWAAREIGEDGSWTRLMDLPPKVRRKLAGKIKPRGKERYNWETDWSSSLTEIGIDVELIRKVNDPQFDKMRDQVMLSHWVWNWITARWKDLLEFENRIHDVKQGKSDAIELESAEGRMDSPIEELGHQSQLDSVSIEQCPYTATRVGGAKRKWMTQIGDPGSMAVIDQHLGTRPQPRPEHSKLIEWEDYLSEQLLIAENNGWF